MFRSAVLVCFLACWVSAGFAAASPQVRSAEAAVAQDKSGQENVRVVVVRAEARATTEVRGDEFHGAVPWFEGTYAQALARARATDSLVMLDFWADWCRPCRRMGTTTFVDERVIAELCGVVCVSVDSESAIGKVLAERHAVQKLPTLVWLAPDASVREVTTGYVGPDEFRRELARVRADRDTLADLQRRVVASAKDVDLRWKLARKLRDIGDRAGAEYQLRAITELDRDCTSVPMRLVKLDEVLGKTYASFDDRTQSYRTDELVAFLATESEPLVLFDGWFAVGRMQGVRAEALKRSKAAKDDVRAAALAQLDTYAKQVWPRIDPERAAFVANEIAWRHWEAAEYLDEPAKRFALEVAEFAASRAPDEAAILDTLACCLWMNGDKARARALVEHCIELEPRNGEWKLRRARFAR